MNCYSDVLVDLHRIKTKPSIEPFGKGVPKETRSCARNVERALLSAVLQWNTGAEGRQKLMDAVGLTTGCYTNAAVATKNRKRLYHSQHQNEQTQKRRREFAKELSTKERKGSGYGPGQFNF